MALAALMLIIYEKPLMSFKSGGEVRSRPSAHRIIVSLPFLDLEHHVQRSLHHLPDGPVLHVHWSHLQRSLLEAHVAHVAAVRAFAVHICDALIRAIGGTFLPWRWPRPQARTHIRWTSSRISPARTISASILFAASSTCHSLALLPCR